MDGEMNFTLTQVLITTFNTTNYPILGIKIKTIII